jgi:hypothetical protein
MIPAQDRSDDRGKWLQFRTGDTRILTAYAPRDLFTGAPFSLGWPGTGAPEYFARAVADACWEQFKWLSEGFESGYKRRFDVKVHVISYGTKRTERFFDLEKIIKGDAASMLDSKDADLQLARIELVRTEGASSNFELLSWMRFGLSRDEAVAIPYGGVGVMVRPRDLQRPGLQDAVAAFILKTHVQGVSAQDVRDMLRNVVARLGPQTRAAA